MIENEFSLYSFCFCKDFTTYKTHKSLFPCSLIFASPWAENKSLPQNYEGKQLDSDSVQSKEQEVVVYENP